MIRWFYDDPLQAAWMAREFDFKIIHIKDSHGIMGVGSETKDIYYIHPDSVSLLHSIPAEKRDALIVLGMWPKSEQEAV